MSHASSAPSRAAAEHALASWIATRVPQTGPTKPAAVTARPDGGGVRALTHAIARGDERAFERFYTDWFDTAYAMARAITRRDESFCLDVVQDAMLKAARSMKPIDTQEQLTAWMRRVVHTSALDRLRAQRRRLERERAAAERASAAIPELDERIEWVRAELVKLPAEERSLLWMRFGRSRTIEQTATAHAMTPGATHGRVRRALARLRDAAGGDPDE